MVSYHVISFHFVPYHSCVPGMILCNLIGTISVTTAVAVAVRTGCSTPVPAKNVSTPPPPPQLYPPCPYFVLSLRYSLPPSMAKVLALLLRMSDNSLGNALRPAYEIPSLSVCLLVCHPVFLSCAFRAPFISVHFLSSPPRCMNACLPAPAPHPPSLRSTRKGESRRR